MLAEFEAISLKMAEPDADIDALASKMDRMQVLFALTRRTTAKFLSKEGSCTMYLKDLHNQHSNHVGFDH
jgi:hypothetical protein